MQFWIDNLLSQGSNLELKLITSSELIFDMLGWSKAFELTSNHDTHFGTESFRFFHWMSSNDNCTLFSLCWNFRDNVPHESFSLRIYTSWWLIQEDKRWVSKQSHSYWGLSFVSSRKIVNSDVNIISKIHIFHGFLNHSLSQSLLNSLKWCANFKMLLYSQTFKNCIELWAITNNLSSFLESICRGDIMPIDMDCSIAWINFSSHTLE